MLQVIKNKYKSRHVVIKIECDIKTLIRDIKIISNGKSYVSTVITICYSDNKFRDQSGLSIIQEIKTGNWLFVKNIINSGMSEFG